MYNLFPFNFTVNKPQDYEPDEKKIKKKVRKKYDNKIFQVDSYYRMC